MRINLFLFVFLFAMVSNSIADPFAGLFAANTDGDQYTLTITKENENLYKGSMSVDGITITLLGREKGNQLIGEFYEDGEAYEFTITANKGETLLLIDEDGESVLFNLVSRDDNELIDSTAKLNNNPRNIYVNGKKVDNKIVINIESSSQISITDGRYWYDSNSGAWGIEGGPVAGFIYPGLPFPGPVPANISGGGTGIFINGREIHPLDQQALMKLFGVTYLGYFWMDAQGNLGYVGGPAIANVFQAAQAKQSNAATSNGSATHGYNSTYGARGTSAGGMYSGRTATGKSVFWYPGM